MTLPWFALLEHKQRVGQMGLTPSFLLGAAQTPVGALISSEKAYEAFVALLRSMQDDVPDRVRIRIYPCPSARQPIAMIATGWDHYVGEAVVRENGVPSELFAFPEYFASASRNLDSLAAGLWNVFGEAVVRGDYSVTRGAFRKFDEADLQFIVSALAFEEL